MGLVCNGTHLVTIKTIHGQFKFRIQKYLNQGISCNYFDLTSQLNQGNISQGLKELVAYYSNRLSYQEVENLVARISGEKLLSDQKIWQIVVKKAVAISEQWLEEMKEIGQEIPIAPIVDIYDPIKAEILLFDDGIGVKQQKANRIRNCHCEVKTESECQPLKTKRKTVITDLVLLQTPEDCFEYITNPINQQGQSMMSLEEIIKYKLKSYYESKKDNKYFTSAGHKRWEFSRHLDKGITDNGIFTKHEWKFTGVKIKK